jgi:acyl-CoA hydrolase
VQLVLPGDANPLGTVFGGKVLQWIDLAASLAAQRHCRLPVVTAAVDALAFIAPIHVGEWAVMSAIVNRTWSTSLEIQVRVEAEHPLTGVRRHAVDAFLTFVAVVGNRPAPVPPLVPETEQEWERWRQADGRRSVRLAARAAEAVDTVGGSGDAP